jgi:hypothetical protein
LARFISVYRIIWRFVLPCCVMLLLLSTLSGCTAIGRLEEKFGVERQDWPDVMAGAVGYLWTKPSGRDLLSAGLLYVVIDPLAPNWHIEESRMSEDVFMLKLTMKRHAAGGEGEAAQLFRRRAETLRYTLGYASYRILNYSEGIHSRYTGAERVSEGQIQLVRH